MNFQCEKPLVPLRVLVVNPLEQPSRLIISKILSGSIFGPRQRITLILLVFGNELSIAEVYKHQLENCAYCCTFSIKVVCNVPSITDADVFCFLTNFPNPNEIENTQLEDNFHALYLIIKIATNLVWPDIIVEKPAEKQKKTRMRIEEDYDENFKPIIIADGLVTLDLVRSFSKNLPPCLMFCPSHVTAEARSVLAAHLKVQPSSLNSIQVWAANDKNLHVEVERPIIIHEDPGKEEDCDVISKDALEKLSMDSTEFNDAWMKKEYIDKIKIAAFKNTYGDIYRASIMCETLKTIWSSRINKDVKINTSIGVISDGSLGTVKGLPYILPVILKGEKWTLNRKYTDDAHVMGEVMKFNQIIKKNHDQLMASCNNLLQQHYAENRADEASTVSTDTFNDKNERIVAKNSNKMFY